MHLTIPFTLLLLGLTPYIQAQQPKAPPFTIMADSVALFSIEEDALRSGRELLCQQGYVSQIQLTPQGSIRFGVWRQHYTYLSADKATRIRTGFNSLPALMQVSYEPAAEGPRAFGPVQDTPISLASGVQTDGLLADQTTATDLNTLLADKDGAAWATGEIAPFVRK